MCGSADNGPTSPAHPVELEERPPARPEGGRARPPSAATRERPHGSSRPPSSRKPRPSTSIARPSSSSARASGSSSRPASSSRRAPKTAGGERHSSSSRGERSRREQSRIPFPSIQEHPEDKTITNGATELSTLIDQHTQYYYPHDGPPFRGDPDFDSPRTRHAAIRRYIAREIIESIMARESSSDLSAIAYGITGHLEEYSDESLDNAQRGAHILELCKLADEVRRLQTSHPAVWEFGSWDEAGFILWFPSVLRDGEQVVSRRIFRTM